MGDKRNRPALWTETFGWSCYQIPRSGLVQWRLCRMRHSRHTFASEMVRLGISLPVLMRLLGHKDIRMTMRYVTLTQIDLQRQFHMARQNAAQLHHFPNLSLPPNASSATADLPGISHALAATRHLLEMFRRQLTDEKSRRQLQRLDQRLLNVASRLKQFKAPKK